MTTKTQAFNDPEVRAQYRKEYDRLCHGMTSGCVPFEQWFESCIFRSKSGTFYDEDRAEKLRGMFNRAR